VCLPDPSPCNKSAAQPADEQTNSVALIVQIHLSQNRLDLATQEVKRARSWAQDNLLVNLAEAWVGLREVRSRLLQISLGAAFLPLLTWILQTNHTICIQGGEKYQSAFYVYEELATQPSTTSSRSLLGQAVAELHLGRLPEAEAAFNQVLAAAPNDADVLANAIVLNTILGKDTAELKEKLEAADKNHMMLVDLAKKRELFATASAKYSPKFEIEA